MTSYQNFQRDKNLKNTKNRNVYDPAFNPTVKGMGDNEADSFTRNLSKWTDFVSWARFFPDLWWDLITPETGGIRLDLDQRVYLRCTARFVSNYMVFPRGYGKTLLEVMGMVHTAIFFPDIELTMTAQTLQNAAKLIDEKWRELLKFYPALNKEVVSASITNDKVEIVFTSGGRIDVMANAQSSKGGRRKRINIEESALLNNELFQDVLEPIVNIPRRTIGKKALINPKEMNGQINYMTTAGFRGSSEFERNKQMVKDMINLKGSMVLGSDWQLAVNYGRGETRKQLLDKKERLSPTFFALNYSSHWVGATDGALVAINKLLDLRVLANPLFEASKNSEIILSVDVARSSSKNNNQTSIAILNIKRNKKGKIIQVSLVNLINLPNGLNFTSQAIEIKRIKKRYNAKAVVVDVNGVGSGLKDELLKEQYDSLNDEILECWNTMNTDDEPETPHAEKILYALISSGINHDIIVSFIDHIESGKLKLLTKNLDNNYDPDDVEAIKKIQPHIETDFFIEEVANLKVVTSTKNNNRLSVEQLTKRVDKDRYSAVAYGLWYIKNFEDRFKEKVVAKPSDYLFIKKASVY